MDIRNYLTATRDSRHGQLAKDYRAIHKTLRRDLRSIPSPTPRSLGVDFLPDVGNQQFTYLFGLEMTVQERLKETLKVSPKQRKHKAKATLRKGTVPPCLNDPMTCDECSTDFTCRWWSVTATTNTGKGQVCDQCKTSRDKKAITEAHTSKLEEAFTRAKQMKLEAKQRLLQVTSLTCRQRI